MTFWTSIGWALLGIGAGVIIVLEARFTWMR